MQKDQDEPESKKLKLQSESTPEESVEQESIQQHSLLTRNFLFNSMPDLNSQICDFLYDGINRKAKGKIEVECKLGILIDKSSQERITLPISTECSTRSSYSQ